MSGTSSYAIELDALASFNGTDTPAFLLLVDGVQVGSGVVNSNNVEDLMFSAALTSGQAHTVSIVYTNHDSSAQMLNVQGIKINGQTISSSDPNEIYISPNGDYHSFGQMYFGGQINFVVPASDFPTPAGSGSTTTGSTTTGSTTTGSTTTGSTTTGSTTTGSTTTGSTTTGSTTTGSTTTGSTTTGSTTTGSTTTGSTTTGSTTTGSTTTGSTTTGSTTTGSTTTGSTTSTTTTGTISTGTTTGGVTGGSSSTGGSVTGTAGAGSTTTSLPAGSTIYVATSGSASGDGSAAHPFSTLQQAITASEHGGDKSIIIESGNYAQGGAINLGAADAGLSIKGQGSATLNADGLSNIIDISAGASGIALSGLSFINASAAAILINGGTGEQITNNMFNGNTGDVTLENGADGNTLSGNTMLSTSGSAIEAHDGSNNNVFSNNTINGVGAANTSGGAFYLHGANSNQITHNLIENTQGAGISLADFYTNSTATQNIGNTIAYNDLQNTDLSSTDSGAIYILGRSLANTQTVVNGNLVNGSGSPSDHSIGIYLDDNANGVTVTNNIVTGSMSNGFQIHGGSNDSFSNNIFDLGSGSAAAGLFQAPPSDEPNPAAMQNDSVTGNIFITESVSPSNPLFNFIAGGNPRITGNDYWSYANAPLNAYPDAAAAYVNPGIGNGNYSTSGDGIGFAAINRSLIA